MAQIREMNGKKRLFLMFLEPHKGEERFANVSDFLIRKCDE